MKTIGIETVCKTKEYNKVLASARLRCYDLINYFKNDKDLSVELYDFRKSYNVVVFQKVFTDLAIRVAQHLNTTTVFDIGTNYLELDRECVNQDQRDRCLRMLDAVDHVSVSSLFLKEAYRREHKSVHFINDAVEDRFLSFTKDYSGSCLTTKIVYCGYSNKAHELLLIKDVLEKLRQKYLISLLYITDKDPGKIVDIPYTFTQFDYASLPKMLMLGDIKVSPRDLNRPYNRGHSVVKIAYPMAVGLPVVASPIPSYLPYLQKYNTCTYEQDWFVALERLLYDGVALRKYIGEENKRVVKTRLSLSVIGPKWKKFFMGI